MPATTAPVLVTGGSGFIAGHIILQLLEQGHRVRSTIRSLDREPQVRQVLEAAGMAHGDALEFVAADLTADEGWDAATAGVEVVLHVASPVNPGHVDDEQTLIGPAREGTLRVLRAAQDAGAKRVVLTSAFHAVGFGQPHDHGVFTEADWSPLDGPGMDAYGRSKVLAERAAWEFVESPEGAGLELVTLQPVAVMGPVMGHAISGSNHLLQGLLTGTTPGLIDLYIPIVDVRDVAAAHVAAVTAPDAAGQRFLIATGAPAMPMREIAAILRENLGEGAAKVPTRRIPSAVVKAAAKVNPAMRGPAADLGFVKQISIERAQRVLGFAPRPSSEAIIAAGRSLVENGLV